MAAQTRATSAVTASVEGRRRDDAVCGRAAVLTAVRESERPFRRQVGSLIAEGKCSKPHPACG